MWVGCMLIRMVGLSAVVIDRMDRDEKEALWADAPRVKGLRALRVEPGGRSLGGEGR
jgi:hypothetical protein